MATTGEKRWPPAGNFVATTGEKPMAIDNRAARQLRAGDRQRPVPAASTADVALGSA